MTPSGMEPATFRVVAQCVKYNCATACPNLEMYETFIEVKLKKNKTMDLSFYMFVQLQDGSKFWSVKLCRAKARIASLVQRYQQRIGGRNKGTSCCCHVTYAVGPSTTSARFCSGQIERMFHTGLMAITNKPLDMIF